MSSKTIIPQKQPNRQDPLREALRRAFTRQDRAIKAAAFHTAFIPESPPDLPAWDKQASRVLEVIVDFRSAVRRWQAAGSVPEAELTAAYDTLDAAGLAGWLDSLIGRGVVR